MAEARAQVDAVQDALAAAREEVARLETLRADQERLLVEELKRELRDCFIEPVQEGPPALDENEQDLIWAAALDLCSGNTGHSGGGQIDPFKFREILAHVRDAYLDLRDGSGYSRGAGRRTPA